MHNTRLIEYDSVIYSNYIKQIKRQIETPAYHTRNHHTDTHVTPIYAISLECLLLSQTIHTTNVLTFQCLPLCLCNVIACVGTFHGFARVYAAIIHSQRCTSRVNYKVYIATGMDNSWQHSRVWIIARFTCVVVVMTRILCWFKPFRPTLSTGLWSRSFHRSFPSVFFYFVYLSVSFSPFCFVLADSRR